MKKYILYIFIIMSYTYSQDLAIENEKIISKNDFIEEYKQSLENFKIKEYEKAYLSLERLFQKKSDNLNINFYLGRSAYETKRYNESILAYERFLFIEPNHNRVKLEMARAYFMVKSYKESKKLLLVLKQDKKLPSSTSSIIDEYLTKIENKSKKNSIKGIFLLGVRYDSNINNRSIHDTFNNIYFPPADIYLDLENSTEDISNWYNQEMALINHKYKINDNKNFKNDFLVFNKDSFNSLHDDTKLTLVSYSPSLSVKHNEKLLIDYALYGDYLSYGGKSKQKSFAIFPKFQYLYSPKEKLSGYVKYQNKSDQQDKTQDKKLLEASLGIRHIFDKNKSVTTKLTIYDEKAKDSSQTDIEYTKIKGFISYNYKYKQNISFVPALTYSISKYQDEDAFYQSREKRKQLKASLSSTYSYSAKWIFQNTIDYTKQKSNIELNEYNKYTFTFNIIRIF